MTAIIFILVLYYQRLPSYRSHQNHISSLGSLAFPSRSSNPVWAVQKPTALHGGGCPSRSTYIVCVHLNYCTRRCMIFLSSPDTRTCIPTTFNFLLLQQSLSLPFYSSKVSRRKSRYYQHIYLAPRVCKVAN